MCFLIGIKVRIFELHLQTEHTIECLLKQNRKISFAGLQAVKWSTFLLYVSRNGRTCLYPKSLVIADFLLGGKQACLPANSTPALGAADRHAPRQFLIPPHLEEYTSLCRQNVTWMSTAASLLACKSACFRTMNSKLRHRSNGGVNRNQDLENAVPDPQATHSCRRITFMHCDYLQACLPACLPAENLG